ncbi:MAG: alpha/beta hydrolase [Alphaproteobacteria bacterium]|nr:alpha/beta hydrolase [Alphaproteobacteria bacterium]
MSEDDPPTARPRLSARMRVQIVVVAAVLLAVVAGIGGSVGYQAVAVDRDADRYPPPGERVDIGGYRLHLHCLGVVDANPTVVFESAPGAWSLAWRRVQTDIARTTRACAYDRAGYGWSDASPEPRSGRQIVYELNQLLINGGIEGPLVLVGHGAGGLWLRRYARRFPDQVAGLVLVDAVEEEVADLHEAVRAIRLRPIQKLATAARLGILRHLLAGRIPIPALVREDRPAYRAAMMRPLTYQTLDLETALLAEDAAAARTIGPFPDLPLAVVSALHTVAGPGVVPDGYTVRGVNETWERAQMRLTRLAADPVHITTLNSDHEIPLNEPEVVVLAIERLFERIVVAGSGMEATSDREIAK